MKPTLDVYLDGTSLRYRVDSMSASLEESKHHGFTAYIANDNDGNLDGARSLPCTLTWGSGMDVQSISGYIDTTTAMTGVTDIKGTAVLGLGATSKLRSGQARSWRRTSPFRIARNITTPYRMGIVVDQYIRPIDAFMQTSESDWSTLVRLAELTGMSLVADGTTIRLIDVRAAIGRALQRPVLTLQQPNTFFHLDTDSPVGFDTYSFNGIDRLGSPFSVSGGPVGGVKRHAPENFANLEEARNASRRWEDRQRKMVRAIATFNRSIAIACGDVVQVEGAYWYVAKAVHEVLQNSSRTVTVELHRTDERRPSTAYLPPSPVAIIRNGLWVSSKSFEVEL